MPPPPLTGELSPTESVPHSSDADNADVDSETSFEDRKKGMAQQENNESAPKYKKMTPLSLFVLCSFLNCSSPFFSFSFLFVCVCAGSLKHRVKGLAGNNEGILELLEADADMDASDDDMLEEARQQMPDVSVTPGQDAQTMPREISRSDIASVQSTPSPDAHLPMPMSLGFEPAEPAAFSRSPSAPHALAMPDTHGSKTPTPPEADDAAAAAPASLDAGRAASRTPEEDRESSEDTSEAFTRDRSNAISKLRKVDPEQRRRSLECLTSSIRRNKLNE